MGRDGGGHLLPGARILGALSGAASGPWRRPSSRRARGAREAALKALISNDVDAGQHPTAVQIWGFGDREMYFVGCPMPQESSRTGRHLQDNLSLDEVVESLKASMETNQS